MGSSDDMESRVQAVSNIRARLEELSEQFSTDAEQAVVITEVDFSSPESIEKALNQYTDRKDDAGFTWGWRGLDNFFAHMAGGWFPGQSLMFAGASDCGKSYMLRLITQWACMYNKPRDTSTRKRKAVVYIVLESEVDKFTHDFFIGAWLAENNNAEFPTDWTNAQKSDYTHKFFGRRGYVLLLYRYGSSELTYSDWLGTHERLSKKYVIEYSILDYLGIMSLEGINEANDAKNRQVLQSKLRTYCGRHGIRYATAAQLKESIKNEFKEVRGVGISIANAGWLADCTALEKETDIMVYVNVEINHLGDTYLTMKLSRIRGGSMPPLNKRVFCMKFEPYGILDDIHMKEPLCIQNLYDIEEIDHSLAPVKAVGEKIPVIEF
jgi:hypothetical protein